jgi:hypothetical protein
VDRGHWWQANEKGETRCGPDRTASYQTQLLLQPNRPEIRQICGAPWIFSASPAAQEKGATCPQTTGRIKANEYHLPMKKHGRFLVLLAVCAILVLLLWMRGGLGTKSPYEKFVSRQATYFAELGHACDSLLKEHQGITNRVLKLAGNESSLPEAVRVLRADEVRVYANRVWIGFDADKDSFAVLWEAQADDPKSWVLMTDFDGILKPVYSVRK